LVIWSLILHGREKINKKKIEYRGTLNPIQFNPTQSNPTMSSCAATLSTHQRRVLRLLLAKESLIIEQCNKHVSRFTEILNELQCIDHHHDSDEHALKSDEFIRVHASLECDITSHDMVPGAIQLAMTCDCMCIQAACFRILYKWIPKLDMLRMKLLKIKNMCADATKRVPKNGVETCSEIEKMLRKLLKPASS